tara:strand:+ start:13406 stop:13528 length:123 start_codon:yes stop_codon:yes gene_type:complete
MSKIDPFYRIMTRVELEALRREIEFERQVERGYLDMETEQ